ncbi:hypothetical protein K449DRAFT_96103 [Hypoxylon sp. EC38]|nr:hypothetical protein K449DRAFT_96103 [Hypoxylon sp. EC38]
MADALPPCFLSVIPVPPGTKSRYPFVTREKKRENKAVRVFVGASFFFLLLSLYDHFPHFLFDAGFFYFSLQILSITYAIVRVAVSNNYIPIIIEGRKKKIFLFGVLSSIICGCPFSYRNITMTMYIWESSHIVLVRPITICCAMPPHVGDLENVLGKALVL